MEFNNKYRDIFRSQGMIFSGMSPDGELVEMIELEAHPWFVGSQFHPEFGSRPNRPHPLFRGLMAAAVRYAEGRPGMPALAPEVTATDGV